MHEPTEIRLSHLDHLTDSTGLIQHAIYSIARRESGYTVDDNARALRLCVRLWCRRPDDHMLSRVSKYLSLLEHARRPGGGFHDLMSYQHQWFDTDSRGDCQGQAVRALAEVLGSTLPDDYRLLARELIEAVLPTLAELRSLRAQAYVILAYGRLWSDGVKDFETLENVAGLAADRLAECYARSRRPHWRWFESRLTYANAVLPHAMLVASRRWPEKSFLTAAQESLSFLDSVTTAANVFWPVGNHGWYPHGEAKAMYDQQPVEAMTMADAALAAVDLTRAEADVAMFRRARDWFHGRNSLQRPLADERTGGCCDGLQPAGINRNQGAESTLAYLWTELHQCELEELLAPRVGPTRAEPSQVQGAPRG